MTQHSHTGGWLKPVYSQESLIEFPGNYVKQGFSPISRVAGMWGVPDGKGQEFHGICP